MWLWYFLTGAIGSSLWKTTYSTTPWIKFIPKSQQLAGKSLSGMGLPTFKARGPSRRSKNKERQGLRVLLNIGRRIPLNDFIPTFVFWNNFLHVSVDFRSRVPTQGQSSDKPFWWTRRERTEKKEKNGLNMSWGSFFYRSLGPQTPVSRERQPVKKCKDSSRNITAWLLKT